MLRANLRTKIRIRVKKYLCNPGERASYKTQTRTIYKPNCPKLIALKLKIIVCIPKGPKVWKIKLKHQKKHM